MMKLSGLLLAALLLALHGCNACEREPCDSFSKPVSATIPQGIAGTVSLASDSKVNGCKLCAFSAAALEIWPAPMAVRQASAACPLAATMGRTLDAPGRYEQALDPGEYLVCLSTQKARPCVGLTVTAGKVTTLNVQHGDSATLLAVFDPGSAAVRSDGFECPKPGA